MKRHLGQTRVRFTKALWAKWLAAREPNNHTDELREGIKTFRALLATRDVVLEYRERHPL